MAEAHEAVAFQFTVGTEGVSVNVSYDVFKVLIYAALRSWKLRYHRTLNSLYNSLYPGHPLRGLAWCSIIYTLNRKGHDPSYGWIDWIDSHMFERYFSSSNSKTLACIVFGGSTYIILIQIRQYVLKKLLSYHGWMYQEHGKKMEFIPMVWGGLVKLLVGRNPSLYSCQSFLPTLPLPSLDDTLRRYLRSIRPLYDDAGYERMKALAEEFKNTIGGKLQRYLWFKWLLSTNYVSDWWEKFVYLRGRSSIMVNSNFYCLDNAFIRPTKIQTARAANIVCATFQYRTLLDHENIKPLMIQKMIPICANQYERQFNTVRIPGKETDEIVHYSDSHHIAVYHKGRWFKVSMFYQNHLLEPCELQIQLDDIVNDTRPPDYGEEHLGALTAGERSLWAEARETYFSTGINRSSLDAIEKSAFVLILDDEEFDFELNTSEKYDVYAHAILHGKAYNRWFDKSFQYIISLNGLLGINIEHSWADAPITGHMYQYILNEDIMNFGYDEIGNTRGTPRFTCLKPMKLKWSIPRSCNKMIEESLVHARKLYEDVDLHIYIHDAYGKDFMKKCRLSPDAYIQMALQLAHYRDSNQFNLTYEASMTRLFRDGRTETVRSCSIESSQWVKSMDDSTMTNSERIRLLRRACDYHQKLYRDAMTGKGVDRHLLCLYILSKYLGMESPFLQEVLHEPWKLSTSQVPASYDENHLKQLMAKNPDLVSKYEITDIRKGVPSGGGFGPVAADGYGISYLIVNEDLLFFHISSYKSSSETDSKRFAQCIRQSMEDMRNLFQEESNLVDVNREKK